MVTAGRLLAVLAGEPKAEADEDGARESVDGAADARPEEDVLRPRDREGVAGQPRRGHGTEAQAEGEKDGEARPRRRELRQEAREKDCHLRVAEVRDDALAKRGSRVEAALRCRKVTGVRRAARSTKKHLPAEEDEVGGAGELDRQEGRLRCDEERSDPDARRERPNGLARCDPERGQDSARAPAEERRADREGRVLPGRDDDERRHSEEREEAF